MQAEIYTYKDNIKPFVKSLTGEHREYSDFGKDWTRVEIQDTKASTISHVMRNYNYDIYTYNDVLNIMLIEYSPVD